MARKWSWIVLATNSFHRMELDFNLLLFDGSKKKEGMSISIEVPFLTLSFVHVVNEVERSCFWKRIMRAKEK